MPHVLRRVARHTLTASLIAILVIAGLSDGLFLAQQFNAIQILSVDSGSMQPTLTIGSAVIDVPKDPASIRPGDIASLEDPVLHDTVTHRVVSVARQANGDFDFRLKGDNAKTNRSVDGETYVTPAGQKTWKEELAIPAGGFLVTFTHSLRFALIASGVALALVLARRFTAPTEQKTRINYARKGLTLSEGETA